MKLMKNQNQHQPLTMIKGQRRSMDALQLDEMDLLREMTNAFQIVHGGQYKVRQHAKLA